MTDIVDRLRQIAGEYLHFRAEATWASDAADEIERLRDRVEKDDKMICSLTERILTLTPEDIGLVKVLDSKHLDWPWYRFPGTEFEYDPQVHGVRDVPEPVREES